MGKTVITSAPPFSFEVQRAMAEVLTKQRRTVTVEPVSAEREPVQAYAEHITRIAESTHYVLRIPDGWKAQAMGYRYFSCPADVAAYFTDRGAVIVHATNPFPQQPG